MKDILKRWWQGTYVPPENDPDSGLVFMLGSDKLHWSSKAAHTAFDFWMTYWQWSHWRHGRSVPWSQALDLFVGTWSRHTGFVEGVHDCEKSLLLLLSLLAGEVELNFGGMNECHHLLEIV
jgi:hypothetical protein